MSCPICKTGKLVESRTTITLEKDATTVVFKHVPADVCDTCGEAFVDENVTARLLKDARQAANRGIEVEIQDINRRAAG